MKHSRNIRMISLALVLVLALGIPSTFASADIISSNGKYVQTFFNQDPEQSTGVSIVIYDENATNVGGWYKVMTPEGPAWVPASSLTVTQPEATPSPSPSPSPTPTPTLIPGTTPTPKPVEIEGETDEKYTGTVLSYTVLKGTGGLALYKSSGFSDVSVFVPEGQTVQLTEVRDATNVLMHYTLMYKGTRYYVPKGALLSGEATKIPTGNIKSVWLRENIADDGMTDRGDVPYYSTYKKDNQFSGASGTMAGGRRVNAAYVDAYAYSFTVNEGGVSKTYYFRSSDVADNSESAASVTDTGDIKLVTQITVSNPDGATENETLRLYRSPSIETQDFYPLRVAPGKTVSLNAQNDIDGWYKVVHGNEYFYVNKKQLEALQENNIATADQVSNNKGVETATFFITIGENGAVLYESYSSTVYDPPYVDTSPSKFIPAGTTVRVGSVNANWYSYSYDANGTMRYIHKKDTSGYSNSTGAVSSYSLKLYKDATDFYDAMGTTTPAKITVNYPLTDDGGATYYNVFTVKSVNEEYFSVVINSRTYYIKKSKLNSNSDAGPVNDMSEISSTTEGRSYTITLSRSATLYFDSLCTKSTEITYPAGKTLTATKYTDSLYVVREGDINYYLPAAFVGSIKGGDDGVSSGAGDTASIGEVIQGEKDDTYDKPLISYTIPTSGLWLYHKPNGGQALSLDGGKVIQLSESDTDGWYSTWYGGATYFVPKTALKAATDSATVNQSLSIIPASAVQLYTDTACKKVASNEKLTAGARYNVKVVSLLSAAEKNALPPDKVSDTSKNYARVYSVVYGGKTRYFPAFTSLDANGQHNIDIDETLGAQVASNTDASLMTRFTILKGGKITLRTSDSTSSSGLSVGPEGNEEELVLYGTKYTSDGSWYRVVYNSGVWFLNKAAYEKMVTDGAAGSSYQIAVAGDVASNTVTVTIGAAGAKCYKSASATEANLYTGGVLAAGQTLLATKNGSWYTATYPGTTDTVYFQLNGGNATSNSTVRSYIVMIPDEDAYDDGIKVYSTIATTMLSPARGLSLKRGQTYTLRTVDNTWSSVTLSGNTYYVKNSDIPAASKEGSIPVSSTTVGKSYTITLGGVNSSLNAIDKYSDATLKTRVGTIPAGTTLTGLKMYVKDAVDVDGTGSGNTSGLVYKVSHNGTVYVDAKYVVGVKDGDEVDEAKEADNLDENANQVGVGESRYYSINAGTEVYKAMSTSSGTILLPTTATYLMTRMDTVWFRLTYNGTYYYLPVSALQPSTGDDDDGGASGGANIGVGTTFMHTLSKTATAYSEPSSNAKVVGSVMPNILIQLKKVSDIWYEMKEGSNTVYLTAADVFGASSGITPPTETTTDGTGIITPTIMITATSGTVNLRKSPSTGSTVLERIPINTTLANGGYEVDANGKVWYKVTYGGKTGYVIGTYVKAVGTVSSGGNSGGNSAAADIGRTLAIDVSSVNIRSGPSTKHTIIGRMEKNQSVVPLAYELGDDNLIWYKFQYNANTVGWIRYDYLRGGTATNTELSGNVIVKQGGTNLRSGAGNSFSVVAKLDRDMIVTIVGSGTDKDNVLWYRVTYGSLSGYVRSDLVRALSMSESNSLFQEEQQGYTELKYGSAGAAVLALQNKLITLGYLAAGNADGTYGNKTTDAVKAFQKAKGMSQTGVATAAVQVAIFNTSTISQGNTGVLNWFSAGFTLINANPNVSVYDINSGITWNAKYIEGKNHADVVPATAADASKLKANNITGSYVRRPVIVTIAGQQFAGSMYAVGHGSTNFVSFFSGVMCIHFTGSKTHGTGNVDADHQAAINQALQYANQ